MATKEALEALATLGTSEEISDGVLEALEKFICQVYKPGSSIDKLTELRWYMFSKKQTPWEKLPPTKSALVPALKRVNYQVMIWNKDINAKPTPPSPIGHRWDIINGQILASVCDLPCAPSNILHLTRYEKDFGICLIFIFDKGITSRQSLFQDKPKNSLWLALLRPHFHLLVVYHITALSTVTTSFENGSLPAASHT